MDVIQQQLNRACQRMKNQADKNRSERTFEVGDMVYMKLQPYIQISVANRSCQKLSYKYFGPFKILQKVGTVAYKLDLLVEARIHPVHSVPVRILDSELVTKGSATLNKLKVQWSHLPENYSTWEEAFDLRRCFPQEPAWGQAGFEEVGIVRKRRRLRISAAAQEGKRG